MEKDMVMRPAHYVKQGMECKDYIRVMTCTIQNGYAAYMIGNVIKYLWRFQDKDGIQDLKKARHYLDFLIEEAEAEQKKIEDMKRG